MSAQHPSGRWIMRPVLTLSGDYYTVTRVVNRRRVHLEYASNGKPMLYSKQQAKEAISKATGSPAHAFDLTPCVEPWHPEEPTEAELLAIDRTYALAKDAGVLDRLRDLRALRQQVNEEPML